MFTKCLEEVFVDLRSNGRTYDTMKRKRYEVEIFTTLLPEVFFPNLFQFLSWLGLAVGRLAHSNCLFCRRLLGLV